MGFGKSKPAPAPPSPPALESGNLLLFGHQAWLVGFAGLLALHAACYLAARFGTKGTMLEPLGQKPMMAAHFLPQLVCFVLAAYWGGGDWVTTMPPMPAPRDMGLYLPQGERISCLMIGFQLYELVACIPCPRLRGPINELLGHHLIVLLLSFLCYYGQAFHWYAPAFMGMAEISSIPLSFVDLFKQFPALREPLSVTNEAVRTVFAILFLIFRGFYWPFCSIWFWGDTLAMLASPTPAVGTPVIAVFLVCNVLMTFLQWYWASLIVKALVQMAKGDPRAKEA